MEVIAVTMDKLQEACVALAEAWNKAMVPFEKIAKALNEAYGRIMQEEEIHEKLTQSKYKSVRHLPNPKCYKISTYNYKPVMRRNLPYQRRNF
jgi:hypothetical protein